MKVVICGAGQVGYSIARYLSGDHNDVTVVDHNPELIQRVNDTLDVRGLVGFASDPDVLESAGIEDADMIIAVTYADEVNMVACQVAHSLFNVPTKIARVRNQSYLKPIWRDLFSRENMPIDVIISPELEVARAVKRRLDVPGTFDVVPFAGDKVWVVGVMCEEDCPVIDTPLRQLTELFPDLNIVVCGIWRENKMIVPTGDDQMLAGDQVYIVADARHIRRALAVFGHEEKEARRVVIAGGGNIGIDVARRLESDPNVRIRLIELNRKQAEVAADALERTIVLNGSALDSEILEEANISATETMVAVTDDDEVNILASLLAKRHGCQRAVTLVNGTGYMSLLGSLGIDTVVNPRATTVSTILQHVRRGRMRAVHSIRDGVAEVMEAEALETSSIIGAPLRDTKIPPGIIVGAVVRGDQIIIPRGDTRIKTGDRVIMFALANAVRHVEKMFTVRLEFF